jgi:hypothetical protein
MAIVRYVAPVGVLVCGVLGISQTAYANLKYTRLEKKPCITCHTTVQGKTLNAVGRCYKDKSSLHGCEAKPKK